MPMSLKELDRTYRRTYRRLITGVMMIYATGLLLGVLLTLGHPKVATWISQAAQAEFVGAQDPLAPEPPRLAQAVKPMRTVKAD
jgi:hypothetical protein